ncbi:MAG: GNAT family N-acetyltransferase [Gemmatimonadales bacterium]
MDLTIRPIATDDERRHCATLMAESEPWRTLGRGYEASLAVVSDPTREVYWIEHAGAWGGFLVLHMGGPFRGYIQTVCLRDECRGRGLGSAVIAWAEERIFRESPNVFLCVSDFNAGARRLYERLGYQVVGSLRDFLVAGRAEVLLRKSRGPWSTFT